MSLDIAKRPLGDKIDCTPYLLRNIILKTPKKGVCVHKDLAKSGKK